MVIYTVERGDSVYSIAQQFRVSPMQIVQKNGLSSPNQLVVGQALVIPTVGFQHTVRSGESLYTIAKQYETTVFQLLSANPSVSNPSQLAVGQLLYIPANNGKLGEIIVNGYSFPSITQQTLQQTLPYLTHLTLFSYQANPDGTLTPLEDSERLITAANAARVLPFMAVTNLDSGGFSSEIAHALLNDMTAQSALIENILSTLKSGKLAGVDLDIEYVFAQDREAYNTFLRRITQALHPQGYLVTTALAPKTSGEQQGLLYQGHDYPVHGQLADHVILMTYEWGYTMGPPMAVAPINQVERVLQYAVSVIPSEKILMGIPNYGYDWTLPYQQGRPAVTISNTAAVQLAYEYGAQIEYDYTAQTPYFHYYDKNGQEHVVWFEDARSIDAKLRLVDKYDLGGVSYWTVNRYFPQNWTVLSNLYDVEKQ